MVSHRVQPFHAGFRPRKPHAGPALGVLKAVPAAQVDQSTPCQPFSEPVSPFVQGPVPPECLPLPPGALVVCPPRNPLSCSVVSVTPSGPGQVSVLVEGFFAAHTLLIVAPDGIPLCTIEVPGGSFGTESFTVDCPVNERVACTCNLTGTTCNCTLDATQTVVTCDYRSTLTLSCAPQPVPAFAIDCILVDKVYDFCFEEDTGLQNCVEIPASCGLPPTGATAECTITAVQCTTGSPVPTGVDGLSTVRVTVTATYDTVIRSTAGTVICTIPNQVFTFTKTVTVCGPRGTTADCEVRAATCGPCTILAPTETFPRGQVCCEFNFCVLVETTAPVKLLVPTLGFCVPARCQTGGFPPGVCPPSPLFPPQCTGFVG